MITDGILEEYEEDLKKQYYRKEITLAEFNEKTTLLYEVYEHYLEAEDREHQKILMDF